MSKLFTGQIGVTGTIGCGKSRVARLLAEHCHLPFIDVDDISRDIMNVGGSGLIALSNYNAEFINDDDSLNRRMLRSAIINSPKVKAEVDALLHPLIHSALLGVLQKLNSKAVIEIPLLYETGWDRLFDVIVVVYAPKKTCIERIVRRDGVTYGEAEAAYLTQIDMEIKKKETPFVVDNAGPWSGTVKNVTAVVSRLPSI